MSIFLSFIICSGWFGIACNGPMLCGYGCEAPHWKNVPLSSLQVCWEWMVLLGSTSLLYKQTQFDLLPAHVHDVMTWLWYNFLGRRWSNCHDNWRVLQQDDYFFVRSHLGVHFQACWWCHRPIMLHIKMILTKQGVVVFHVKSACGQYSWEMFFCYLLWYLVATYNFYSFLRDPPQQ